MANKDTEAVIEMDSNNLKSNADSETANTSTKEKEGNVAAKPTPAVSMLVRNAIVLLLVFQNSSIVLITRYSRIAEGDMYFATTAVLMAELLKLLISICALYYQHGNDVVKEIMDIFTVKLMETVKMSVPAILYAVQNNVNYIAYSNLDAAVFQVLTQLKILTTAFFSVVVLRKEFSLFKWLSFIILFIGISLVQLDTMGQTEEGSADSSAHNNPLLGFLCILLATSLSGFVGVYIEKQLKGVNSSLWVKNIQLSMFGSIAAVIAVIFNDGSRIMDQGFFYGYNIIVCLVILNQAGGGILVAVVIKYADNIIKGFATSAALIVSFVASIFLFGFVPTILFLFGLSAVCAASYMYSLPY